MSTTHRPPRPLLLATALVALEAAALVVLGFWEVGVLSTARATMGVTTALFFLSAGAGLGFCAWSLHRLRSWARAPVVLAQLIQLGLAWSFRGGDTTPVAATLALVALVVMAGVFSRTSIAALDAADARPV
ncbi:MAG TPA: hypothetical protein VER39_08250 [Nocardioidaceae bacterium]|nr:hypothetical protein [Nocardioidaceae bacterium]